MADNQLKDDLSMEDYFENGVVREDTEVPAKQEKKSRIPSGKKKRQSDRGRRILIVGVAVLVLALVIWLIVSIIKRKNDGAGKSEKLAQFVGSSFETAKKEAGVDLDSKTDYLFLDNLMMPFIGCKTSGQKAEVQGVTLPEWAIYCKGNDGMMNSIWFFDYEVLEDNPYGTERKSYIEPSQFTQGADIAKTESQLGLSPYCTRYQLDHTQVREYRYCFEDAASGDLTAYIITCTWDANGALTSVTDMPVDFISMLVKSSLNE